MAPKYLSAEAFEKLQSLPAETVQQTKLGDAVERLEAATTLDNRLEAVLTIYACLDAGCQVNDDGNEVTSKLVDTIIDKLLPVKDSQKNPLVAEVALACLSLLLPLTTTSIDDIHLFQITAYTWPLDPWTTEIAAESASHLLETQLSPSSSSTRSSDHLADFIIGPILQDSLKPLFAKSASSRVTASGRPSLYDDPTPREKHTTSELPAWKTQTPWALSSFRWAVKSAEESLVEKYWPLFTPVLLSLAEDEDMKMRTRGLECLACFVIKTPSKILHTTGIGSIFEDVTFPSLLYLPSLNSEEESVAILTAAYNVLLNLCQSYQDPHSLHRRKLLDKILRDGIYAGFQHASEYAHIVQVLMEVLESVVKCMGIYSVKHMQNLLPMISSIMTDPFATAHPPTIHAAAKALISIMTNCWPRLAEKVHEEQIIKIISISWINLNNDGDSIASRVPEADKKAISEQLLLASKIMQSIWAQPNHSPPERLAEVVEKEPTLAELFPPNLYKELATVTP